jgi:glutamate 5-kinase
MTGQRPTPEQMKHRRIVVKVGSNVLTAGTGRLDLTAMAGIAAQIASLQARGAEVILVTSGSIAAGRHRLGERNSAEGGNGERLARDVQRRQVLAAVGQSRVVALWDEIFEAHDIVIAQALLTRIDLAERLGYLNARNVLLSMLSLGVVPVVNENDVVSVEEISDSVIGDNDNLSALVANLVDADLLLMLTDTAGLYSADPAHDPDAQLIETVETIDASILAAARGTPGPQGTGGMSTKVQAARIATQSGTHVVIADGSAPDVVLRAVADEAVGTHFLPTGDRTESRRRYLLSGLPVRGRITVDAGATRALRHGGTSLLPAGVTGCTGSFRRGDVVQIVSDEGAQLASGMTNYGADEVQRILGKHSNQIAAELGYEFGEEIVHRNNLVLVEG